MKINLKKINPVLLISAIGVAIVLIVFPLLAGKNSLTPKSTEVQQQINQEESPAIQNTDDLNNVNSELDNINLDEFDKELNQLDVDASSF